MLKNPGELKKGRAVIIGLKNAKYFRVYGTTYAAILIT